MIGRKTVSQCVSVDYCKGWNDAVDNMPKWISVEERLPQGDVVKMTNGEIGVPACYGCIESVILRSGACLHCDHVEGCEQFAASLKKDMEELLGLRLRR